ncbi:PQ loop repeat-domain-containing protein, partial [Elsinoe ampelina]
MNNPTAATILGTTSAVCWSIQLLPQILLNYRRHNATGLQPSMMLLWALAGVPLGVYNIVSSLSIALQIQAQILTSLSLVTWGQVYYYNHKWPKRKCLLSTLLLALLLGSTEYALTHLLRLSTRRSLTWPTTLMAVLAAALLAAGVLRHYWDMYLHRTVRGVSFLFCALDALGDLTAILSICFREDIEVLGIVIYGVELGLWCGVFVAGGVWNFREWVGRKR